MEGNRLDMEKTPFRTSTKNKGDATEIQKSDGSLILIYGLPRLVSITESEIKMKYEQATVTITGRGFLNFRKQFVQDQISVIRELGTRPEDHDGAWITKVQIDEAKDRK